MSAASPPAWTLPLSPAFLDDLAEGCLLLDRTGTCRYRNAAAGRWLGLAPGQRLAGHAPGLSTPAVHAALRSCLEDGAVAAFAADLQDPPRTLAFRLRPEAEGASVLVTDVTRDRAADLLLTQTQEELERFAYAVAHDLRAPLRHIAGFADLLRAQDAAQLSAKGQSHLATIQNSARRMGELLDALLAYARTARTPLCKRLLDLDSLVARVITGLAPACAGRTVHWEVPPLPRVSADASLLQCVFSNLLGNALKFTQPRAEARIQVLCGEDAEAVSVTIQDNGVGFDPHLASRLFGVFQTLHPAQQFPGAGIGLAQVQRIIARHGGRVWAEGSPGQGARFGFSLPRPENPLEPQPSCDSL